MVGRWLMKRREGAEPMRDPMTGEMRKLPLFEVTRSGSFLGLLRSDKFDEVTGIEKYELQFRKSLGKQSETNQQSPQGEKGKDMARLELVLMAGAQSKEFLDDLTKLVTRLEKAAGKKVSKATEADEDEETDEEEDDEALATKKKKKSKKTAKTSDDDEDEEGEEEDDEEEETEEEEEDESDEEKEDADEEEEDDEEESSTKKKKKSKKLTVDDVNDACMAKAKEEDRKVVLGILKKKFKVTSVTELKPDQYAAVIKAMKV